MCSPIISARKAGITIVRRLPVLVGRQTRVAVAARKLGVIRADIAVALSLSMTHKAIGFDRRMPDVDFDTLDMIGTNTLPVGVEGAARAGGARNRQQARHPIGPDIEP
jgi:hypothetical protein